MGLHYKALILVRLGLWVYISLCSIEGARLHITEILRYEASAKYIYRHTDKVEVAPENQLLLQLPFGFARSSNICSMYWSIICWKHCIFKLLFCI